MMGHARQAGSTRSHNLGDCLPIVLDQPYERVSEVCGVVTIARPRETLTFPCEIHARSGAQSLPVRVLRRRLPPMSPRGRKLSGTEAQSFLDDASQS
jgi:hypothetical protein